MDSRIVVRVGLVLLSAAILQRGVFAQFRLGGVAADALLLAALAAAVVVGPDRGAVAGFASGVLVDLQVHTPFGLTALTYCLVAWFLGRFEATVVRSSRLTVMATGFVGTALGQVGFALLGELVGVTAPGVSRLAIIAGVTGLWNALLMPPAVRIMRWAWDQPADGRFAFSSPGGRRR